MKTHARCSIIPSRLALLAAVVSLPLAGLAQIEVITDGKVGVGTSTPAYKFELVDATTASGTVSRFTRNSKTLEFYVGTMVDVQMGTPGNHSLGFYTNNNDPLVTLTAGQKVGIGTATPNFPLDVATGPAQYALPALNILPSTHGTSERATIGFGFTATSIDNGWIMGQDYNANSTREFYLLSRTAGVSTVRWFIDSSGNVGIGTTSPLAKLEASGSGVSLGGTAYYNFISTQDHTNYRGIFLGYDTSGQIGLIGSGSGGSPSQFSFLQHNGSGYFESVRINTAGNVGIGTSTPSQKLEVAGSVRATSFIADINTYADFVFAPDYQLPALSEVEAHIKAHGHLPGIPSEAEAKANGIDLAVLQVKLLQKIEELTLHQIAQEKRLNEQSGRIQRLEAENAALRATSSTNP